MTEQPMSTEDTLAALQDAAQPMSHEQVIQEFTNNSPGMAQGSTNQQNSPPPQQLASPAQVAAQAQQPQQPQSQLYNQASTTAPVEGEDFLANLGLNNVPDSVSNDTYPAVLLNGNAGTYNDKETGESRKYISFTWKIDNPASEFNGEVVDGDFCNAHAGIDNKDKRRLRDRLNAVRLPTQGVGDMNRMNQLLESKKGCPVWIKTYARKNGDVMVVEIAPRDAGMQAQMGQQAVTQQQLQQGQAPQGYPQQAVSRDY